MTFAPMSSRKAERPSSNAEAGISVKSTCIRRSPSSVPSASSRRVAEATGLPVTTIGLDADGVIKIDEIAEAMVKADAAGQRLLVAVHLVNNETGVIQPVEEIGRIVKAAGGILVLDAVQAAGRIPLDVSAGCADYLILSSHKIGGPKGVGAIVAAADLMMPQPLVRGGGQEKGHRAGTENLLGIAGFGMAAQEALSGLERIAELRQKRDAVESIVAELVPDAVFFGAAAPRLANTSFFAIPGMKAETAQIAFDLAGVALSSGSACSSGKVGPSHVLKAMGVEDGAGALRVSVGLATWDEDIALFRKALAGIVARRAVSDRAA